MHIKLFYLLEVFTFENFSQENVLGKVGNIQRKFLRIFKELVTIAIYDIDYDVFYEIVHACYLPELKRPNFQEEEFLVKILAENEKYQISLLSKFITDRCELPKAIN